MIDSNRDKAEIDNILEAVSTRIKERRLENAAVLFLELYKPLHNVAFAASVMSAPIFCLLFGASFEENLRKVLESPENIEKLIIALEK